MFFDTHNRMTIYINSCAKSNENWLSHFFSVFIEKQITQIRIFFEKNYNLDFVVKISKILLYLQIVSLTYYVFCVDTTINKLLLKDQK